MPFPKLQRSRLARLSRDPRLLLRGALGIGAASLAAGLLISLLSAGSGRPFLERILDPASSADGPARPRPGEAGPEAWALLIRAAAEVAGPASPGQRSPGAPPETGFPGLGIAPDTPRETEMVDSLAMLERVLAEAELGEGEKDLLLHLARGLLGDAETAAAAAGQLRAAAAAEPPRPFAAEYLGDVMRAAGRAGPAIEAYQREVDRFPGSRGEALRQLVRLLRLEEREAELHALMARPELRERFSLQDRVDLAVARRDYLGLLGLSLLSDLRPGDPWLALLSVFAAAIWFIIVTQFSGRWKASGALYGAALALGWLSASVTLWAVTLQEEVGGFRHDPGGPVLDQIIYCVAGIGLREETLKLLLFLPLAPLLARRGRDIDALACAGLVGLGFALNENIGYVGRGGAFVTWGRFLTANFLHVALTGIAGLALVRFWRRPRRRWEDFLQAFLLAVAIHGIYDALLMIPQAGEYAVLHVIVYAAAAYLFLDKAIELAPPQASMTVSPLAVFVLGGAALMGVVLCYACWAMPFRLALASCVGGLAGMLPVAFVFISRLRHL